MLRVLAALGAIGALFPGTALGAYAPVDRPGPSLSVPPATLARALKCTRGVAGASRTPVLLVHATGATREENWASTYEPGLDSFGIPGVPSSSPSAGPPTSRWPASTWFMPSAR